MHIIKDNRCNFCETEIETLIHLFWNCDITKIFWNKIFNQIAALLDTKIEFSATEVLFYCPISEPLPFNFIFALAKQHIYYCKTKNICPNLFNFINFINHIRQMEFSIAQKNKSLKRFESKWAVINILHCINPEHIYEQIIRTQDDTF